MNVKMQREGLHFLFHFLMYIYVFRNFRTTFAQIRCVILFVAEFKHAFLLLLVGVLRVCSFSLPFFLQELANFFEFFLLLKNSHFEVTLNFKLCKINHPFL